MSHFSSRVFVPRSLKQLVVIAFLLVLLPLLILAYQAYQSLGALSHQSANINQATLSDARLSEAMIGIALEMERSYRQYCVLRDNTLLTLYQNQRRQYAQLLQRTQTLPNQLFYRRLGDNLIALAQVQCDAASPTKAATANLEAFAKDNNAFVQTTRQLIYQRGQQLQHDIASRGKYLGWQALLLFLVSLALVLLFTRMIIKPVKQIERMINRLGAGKNIQDLPPLTGPNELRSLGKRILWLSERLNWLESQRHEFLRHISHELKTPLASIREGTELLADQVAGQLTAEQQEIVTILDNSSRNLQELIEQLLDYNRKLADGPLILDKVDLSLLCQQIILAHSLPAKAKQMQTILALQQQFCSAEQTLLIRVLDNLYSNAVHYGPEKGTIWIKSRRHQQWLEIDVINSGKAIPDAEQPLIFEAFYQGSQQRNGAVKGSGLGLSIARECAQHMQGSLQLISEAEQAVCFRLQLPFTMENE